MHTPWQDKARSIMQTTGVSQQNIADALSVTKGTVSHWMRGRHRPSLKQLRELARVLDVSLPELIEDDEGWVRDELELAVLQRLRTVDQVHRKRILKMIEAIMEDDDTHQ